MYGRVLLGLLLVAGMAHGADLEPAGVTPAPVAEFVYNKEFMSGILNAFMSPKGVNITRFVEAFNPTPCLQKCMPTLGRFLESFGTQHSLRDTKDTVALCRQLESVESCAATANCDSTLIDLATKMYKFACIEKIESIGDSLKCAQDAFSRSRAECETGCIVDRSSTFDASKLPIDVSSICESSVCLLGCMQKSINSACLSEGSTPSLFNAILSTSKDDNTLSSLLSGMLPRQCRDVLKTQSNLSDSIAHLASVAKDSIPSSVGKLKADEAAPSTTTVSSSSVAQTTVTRPTVVAVQSTTPSHPALWAPEPIETPIQIDGEVRTLQCRVLDWERRPVVSPSVQRLAQLIAQQLLKHDEIQMRADDGDESEDKDWAFRRWVAAHDPASYRALGFGVPSHKEGEPIPQFRANSADPLSIFPSWFHLLMAACFPFVIYLM
ncbi:hypothetical protein PFISCL1PPCAC_1522 [Pristionchus fissidentatus]|uniref:Chondroitin proteoglycan 4 domain-containing protein n=1 Tax=Pristionchus fissidentatus TaxID=1538716 RepID=A0AAV5UVQ1_9BILA|nr:hypothetical protein PFISCL1PPCAC_1522 [Pristionchus fissidentatus]